MSHAEFNILGHLGSDVEFKTSANGHKYAVISVATVKRHPNSNGDGWVDKTNWHRLICHKAHLMNYLAHFKKGMVASFRGEIGQNVWEDSQQQKHYDVSLEVNDADLIGRIERKSQNNQQQNNDGQGYQQNNGGQGYQQNNDGQGYQNHNQNMGSDNMQPQGGSYGDHRG